MSKTLHSGFIVTARLNGEDLGEWQTCSGGQIHAAVTSDRSPGQKYASQIGGLPEIQPVTVSRIFDWQRDTDAFISRLNNLVGVEGAMTVAKWTKDSNGQPFRKIKQWTGTLTEVNDPDTDENSSDRAVFELVMAPTGA